MVFLRSDWWRQWCPLVSQSDSSARGWGVSTAVWPRDRVAEAGRVLERSHFRRVQDTSARDSVLSVV
eukprot:4232935-Lingulodinium_polyedra.AAC.1